MESLNLREWLLTNGLGSFASGTVCDLRTRKYHGWLISALTPPTQRTFLLSHIKATLCIGAKKIALNLDSFTIEPTPTWVWKGKGWHFTRQLLMPYGRSDRLLIHYQYEGEHNAQLSLRPLIGDRNFHHEQLADSGIEFTQQINPSCLTLQGAKADWQGTPWQLCWSQGKYHKTGEWVKGYELSEERARGLSDREDLYCPGTLSVSLQPRDTVTLEARVGISSSPPALNFSQALEAETERIQQLFPVSLWQQGKSMQSLLRASEQFIVHRASTHSPTVIAGYPWFNDWGRDTLIALPGLTLTTQRYELAKGLLATFAHYCQRGLIPNTFPDFNKKPIYNSIDASLWWLETLGFYLEATQDWDFLQQQYATAQGIYSAFQSGTDYNICVDPSDRLLSWDAPQVAITWMDVVIDGKVITPRRGKAVEINALWYSALHWLLQWATRLGKETQPFQEDIQILQTSLQKFWNPETGYLYDTIQPNGKPNAQIRPNAVIALSLSFCGFSEAQGRSILNVAKHRLLTPYGLRSLDPDDAEYLGSYAGDRDHRDSAYHSGTVWSWLIGSFIRAWERFYPHTPSPINLQPLIHHLQEDACIGSISEIFDGDAPHQPQGAIAQAWSVAELIRHFEQNLG